MNIHPLDDSLELHPLGGAAASGAAEVFACGPSARYRNAIGPFGGWIAALLLKSVLSVPQVRGTPLALDALFMGGMHDADLEVRVYPLRQNRSVGFWRSEVWQAGRICAHAQVTLSAPRTSVVFKDARCPQVPHFEQVPVYENPRASVPWLDQYVFKPVSGFLFSQAESMDARLWIRDAQPRPIDAISLAALCDTPFPPTWIRLSGQTPVSTVSYSVYFRASEADFAAAGEQFCLLDMRASLAQGGYVDQFTAVWSAAGALLAQTQQMLWFSDAVSSKS
jgi:acyl-CoA thioesterase